MKAVRVHRPGSPDALVYEDVPNPVAGPGQVVVRVEAAGVNFADTNARRASNTAPPPVPLGGEAAGTIVEVGPDSSPYRRGDKVAFRGVPGAFAEMVAAPIERLARVPNNLTTRQAAASLAQGMSAHYLACSAYPIRRGDTCLVQAAAGGVGHLLCQMARMRGARVIGTVSTEEKAKVAREAGADEVILYTQVDFAEEVKRLTGGQGVDVVYDSVGQTTFLKGLTCLRPHGMMVLFGQSSGPVEPLSPGLLSRGGSLYLTSTGLASFIATQEEMHMRASEVFGWVASGALKVHVHAEYPLREAGAALDAIQNRATIGKVLLIP